jgi:peptide/nickel transport system substrate-binding protein
MRSKRFRFLVPLFAAGLVAAGAACDSGEEPSGGSGNDGELPRDETFYTTGTEWGTYANWNPFTGSGYATGSMGLVYEALFLFNPHTVELEPWLAESGEWISDNEYVVQLREGIEWHDGEAFNAEDVVFTFDLREFDSIHFSNTANWIESVTADGDYTVQFTLSETRKGEFENLLYQRWIGPEHLWSDLRGEGIAEEDGLHSVTGTGSYRYVRHDEGRAVYERNDGWWGTEALGMEMSPKYIVDFANSTHNATAQADLEAGTIDLSNNYLPPEVVATNDQIGSYGEIQIPWNVAYLLPNTTKAPMDDAEFRRAMAFAINVQQIIDDAYGGTVSAANPTGLLGTWVDAGMVDEDVVAEHGFSYDAAEANSILDGAGYEYDGDWRTTPDGEPIELTLIVPDGWTDWNIAADIIAQNLQEVGLNVIADFPEAAAVDEARNNGEFDLVVNNWTNLENHPYKTYYYLFEQPVNDLMTVNNFERYENDQAWQLAQEFATLSVGERDEGFDNLHSQLQEIALQEMPAIPMWYNGLWSQWNTTYWTGWPQESQDGPFPSMWGGVFQLGSVKMFAQLESAGEE